MQSLGKVGKGVGTAIGVPLTGLAMVQAARSGRDPLAVLRAATGQEEPLNQLQQAQLAQAEQQGLLARIKAAKDPATHNFLLTNPDIAEKAGYQMQAVPVAGTDAGPGIVPGPDTQLRIPALPDASLAPSQELAQEQLQFLRQLRGQGGGGTVQPLSQAGVGQGGLTPVSTGGAGAVPTTAQEPGVYIVNGEKYRAKSFDARGMPQLERVGPMETQVFEPGTLGPAGEIKGGDVVGGKTALVKTARAAEQTKTYTSRVKAARAQMSVLSGPLTDPKTKQPVINPDTGQPATYADAFLGTGVMGNLIAALPGAPEKRMEMLARGGTILPGFTVPPHVQKAAQAVQSMQGSVSAAARIGGEVGALAEKEQTRFQQAFIPGAKDSADSAAQKLAFFDQTMDSIEKAMAAGATPEQLGDMYRDATAAAEGITGGQAPPPPAAPTTSTAPTTQTTVPPAVQSGKAKLAGILGVGGQPIAARAKGGPVAPKQIALVGEQGPELSISDQPRTIVPLQQMAQAQPQMVPGPQVLGRQVMVPAGTDAPRQLQGLGQGQQGLTPEDALRATQGGVVIIQGPNGEPVVVPR